MDQILIVSSVLLWVVLFVNLFLTLAIIRRLNSMGEPGQMDKPELLEIGQQAPSFTAETLNGEKVTLTTYTERSAAFVFVTPSCEPCREEMPTLELLGPKAKISGIELVIVSTTSLTDTQDFVRELNIKLPVLVAPQRNNPFKADYKVPGTPFYCLINHSGKVQMTGFFDSDWQALTEEWDDFAEKPSEFRNAQAVSTS